MNLEVDKQRLTSEIEELALISDAEAPAVTRIVFSPTDLKARAWFVSRCKEAGLPVRQAAIGNLFARWNGGDPNPAAGFQGELETLKLPAGYYEAFVELHIEQGPLLEQKQIPLGIVRKIAAPSSFRISIEGAGGHAGGVLMPDRRDALCAASELILAIEHDAKASGSRDT